MNITISWLAEGEKSSFLAYFDGNNNNFNLATDLKGAMNFDFGKRFTSDTIKSSFSPAFVPINGDDQAYVFWSTKDARKLLFPIRCPVSLVSGYKLNKDNCL